MSAPNQPPGGNGRGRQPPAQPSAGQPQQRPAAPAPSPARPPQPAVPNPAALRPQPPQQQRQPVSGRPPQQPARIRRGPRRATPCPLRGGVRRRRNPPLNPHLQPRRARTARADLRKSGLKGPQAAPSRRPLPPSRDLPRKRNPRPSSSSNRPHRVRRASRLTLRRLPRGPAGPACRATATTAAYAPAGSTGACRRAAAASPGAPSAARPPLPPDTGRAVPGAGDPYPALVATPLDGVAVDPRPISARSPRGAAQPESVPMPSLLRSPSRRSRNPFVIVGNLFLTLFFLIAICGGVAFVIGKQRFELAGPLTEDRIVNVPRGGRGVTADLLMREGVIDQPYLFIAGVMMSAARTEIRRIPLRQRRKSARRRRHHHGRQGGAACLHRCRGPDLRPDRAEAHGKRRAVRQYPRRAARRHAVAGDLSLHPRHDARTDRPPHAAGPEARAAGGLGAPQPRPAGPHAGATRDARLDHREGNRQAGGAHPRRRGVRQPAAPEDEAAIGSDHHLRPGRRQRHARPADHAQRDRAADALQHLCDRRAAARTDRQSGPRLAGSSGQSGAHQGTVLRRRRHRRSRLLRHLRATPAPRGAAAPIEQQARGAAQPAAAAPRTR